MTFAEDSGPIEETLGPGTDLVISLFSTFLLLGVLGAALAGIDAKDDGAPLPKPREDVIALDPVQDGFQHFRRQSAEVDASAIPAIVKKLRPLERAFEEGQGRYLVHVIGYASPEPFGTDDGEANFQLALQRAMTIAGLSHRMLRIPFECLRVHGYGRGESASLTQWLGEGRDRSVNAWDNLYRQRREKERASWPGGAVEWQGAYTLGKTDLGRELSTERRVVLKTELAENDLCARAFKERPPAVALSAVQAPQPVAFRNDPSRTSNAPYRSIPPVDSPPPVAAAAPARDFALDFNPAAPEPAPAPEPLPESPLRAR